MTETCYVLADDAQVLALGAELARLGFGEVCDVDCASPASIRELLSDVKWSRERWSGEVPYQKVLGFHPVGGPEGAWDSYLAAQGGRVWLVLV